MKANWYAARDAAKRAGGIVESSEEGSYAIWISRGGNLMACVESHVFSASDGQAHTLTVLRRGATGEELARQIEAEKDRIPYVVAAAVAAIRSFAAGRPAGRRAG
jgi:hypothetical protein